MTPGTGSLTLSGFGSVSAAKDAVKVGFDYYKANATGVSASVKAGDHNYHIHIVELHNTGPNHPRRTVRKIPDRFLCPSGGCGV